MLGWAGTYEDNMVIFRYTQNPGGQRIIISSCLHLVIQDNFPVKDKR